MGVKELLKSAIVPIIRWAFIIVLILAVVVLTAHFFPVSTPLATIVFPGIVISTPITELVVAISELVIALAIIVGEVLPFLSTDWTSIIDAYSSKCSSLYLRQG